jgi:hypothetical protein
MLNLEDITYSRSTTIAAIRSYYNFLTTLYLDSSKIISPPPSGWPEITTQSFTLKKSKSVIHLLQHLPYIKTTSDDTFDAEGAPECQFADWNTIFQHGADRNTIRIGTEDSYISEHVPTHVVGLTCGGMYNPRFLLDVKLGTIHWYKCPSGISDNPCVEPIQDDPYDYCSEDEEAEWRDDGETWGVVDFFEELKERFRRLEFVPLSERKVVHVWKVAEPGYGEMIEGVKGIYRKHGWPDVEKFEKRECLREVGEFIGREYAQWLA